MLFLVQKMGKLQPYWDTLIPTFSGVIYPNFQKSGIRVYYKALPVRGGVTNSFTGSEKFVF